MVRERNNIKKMKKQLNKNLSCLNTTPSIRQTTPTKIARVEKTYLP